MKKLICLLFVSLLPVGAVAQKTSEAPARNINEGFAQVSADNKVAVASVNPDATRIAMDVVKRGGNAVDAAVAVAFALGVVDAHNSGIGGGCFVLVRLADGRILAIDGREMAPAAAQRDMFLRAGQAVPELSRTGALAVGVPGSVMALHRLQKEGGKLSFADVILPSADLAEQGFDVSVALGERLAATARDLARFPAAAAIYLDKTGHPHAVGSAMKNPDLARTYRELARRGPDYFYRGEFAKKSAAWMKANGGLITQEDFANYEIKLREPVVSTFKGYSIYGFPPPSSGGIHVAQILNILENFELQKTTSSERYHLIAEAMKFAFADRAHWLGDSDFTPVPMSLTDKAYAKTIAKKIRLDKVHPAATHGDPNLDIPHLMNKHTTHIAAADQAGNWVAITSTVNTSFGSKVVIPGTGVVLNNQMDDFSAQPGAANAFGLVGTAANAVAPKKRPLSSMSPTLVFKDNKPVMTLGAAGGPTIISQVVQNLLLMLEFGMPAEQAIKQPRIHEQWNPDILFAEAAMPAPIQQALTQKGHSVKTWPSMGVSQIVYARDGQLVPVSEPRIRTRSSAVEDEK